MAPVSSQGDREQVIGHLLESRRLYGSLRSGEVSRAAQVCGVSTATIYRWLAKGSAGRTGRSKFVPAEEDQVAVFQASGNITLAYELRKREGANLPSLATFRRGMLTSLDRATLAAARGGIAARDANRMVLSDRRYRRNERWEGDHTQLEISIVSDHLEQPVRPWLTWLIDAGTRYLVGWALSTERPTRGAVLAAIRMGVSHNPQFGPAHGRPELLFWDNGLEFTANAVTEAGARLGSLTVTAYPYSPSKKPKIERINFTIERELLAGLPHYTNGPRRKDGSLYFGPNDHLTLDQFVVELTEWIANYNSKRPHSSLDGRTPCAAWLEDPTPIVAVDNEEVRFFTLEHVSRKVRRDLGVHVGGVAYTAPGLIGLEGEEVEVGRVPFDDSFVEVFHQGEWICTAKPTTTLSPNEVEEFLTVRNEKNRVAARLRRQATRRRMAPITQAEPDARLLNANPGNRKRSGKTATELFALDDQTGTVE